MTAKTEDRRIQRTRALLLSALLDLIVERGYEDVSVQDIVDRANVGRSTFYKHFLDKRELLLSGVDGLQELLTQQRAALVEPRVQRILADLVQEELAACVPAGAVLAVPLDVVVQYTVSAFLGLLRWWMEQPAPCAAEEIDRQFRALTIPAITTALAVPAVAA